MTTYYIFTRTDEHPRTINTPRNGRTYYSRFIVNGKKAMEEKVQELKKAGVTISEIVTSLGVRVYL